MISMQTFPKYLAWANQRCLKMVQSVDCTETEKIFMHILDAEAEWANRIKGETYVRSDNSPDLNSFSSRIEENTALFQAIITSHTADEPVSYHNFSGDPFVSQLSDIILQVWIHGAYHRGQIFQCIKQKGGEELETDYILFTRS